MIATAAATQVTSVPAAEDIDHLTRMAQWLQERQPRHEKRVAAVLSQLPGDPAQAIQTLAGEVIGLLRAQRELAVLAYNNLRDLTARAADLEDDTDDLADAVESGGGGVPAELAQGIAEMLGTFAKSVEASLPQLAPEQRKGGEAIIARCQYLVAELEHYVADDDDGEEDSQGE
jgi:hypothetical protein